VGIQTGSGHKTTLLTLKYFGIWCIGMCVRVRLKPKA
jgi:hypothetical protein